MARLITVAAFGLAGLFGLTSSVTNNNQLNCGPLLAATYAHAAVEPTDDNASADTKDNNNNNNNDDESNNFDKYTPQYTPEQYEAAMPDYHDPIDGPQLECTACLTVADVIANRFSRLKREFRINMENIKNYHVEAALDELCTREQVFMGLLMPNASNVNGVRSDKTFREERMQKEDEILKEYQSKYEEKAKKLKINKKTKAVSAEQEAKAKAKKAKRNKGKSEDEIKWEDEEKEWKKIGLPEDAIARRKRFRVNHTIWPEYTDERELRRKVNGGIPTDVVVVRNTQIHTEWQRYCDEAMGRVEAFGVVKVFRGSRKFSLCPMCTHDVAASHGRSDNPGGISDNKDEANAVSDAELKKKKAKLDDIRNKRADAADDEEDEKFIRGKDEDESEL